MPIVFNIFSSAGGVARGESSMTINFAAVTAGKHIGVGSSTMTVNVGIVTAATRETFGSSVLPVVFSFTTHRVQVDDRELVAADRVRLHDGRDGADGDHLPGGPIRLHR